MTATDAKARVEGSSRQRFFSEEKGIKLVKVAEKGSRTLSASNDALVVLVIRIVCVGLLAYWSLILVGPFLTIIAWSAIIAVALYPIYEWLSSRFSGHRKLAAIVVGVLSLLIILGPVTWLGLSLADSVRKIVSAFNEGRLSIPTPPDAVRTWPFFGKEVYDTWQLASTNLKALIVSAAPWLKPLGSGFLGVAGSAGIDFLKFIIAVLISGFLLVPGPSLVHAIKNVLGHVASERGKEFVDLSGATIRNVSRGIIGVAALQTLLAGIGMLFAGVPAAGLLSFLVLLLGIVQIGPSIVILPLIIWSWFTMDATMATLFTLYMAPVSLIDNVLRPLVMAKGLHTPIAVILVGVVGGTLAHGMIGLFVGPIVLSITWQLLAAWTRDEIPETAAAD
jgi:predicted PurR-regulated permease PerM